MLDLICDVLPALSIAQAAAIFLVKVGRWILLGIIRRFDAAETSIDQVDEHSLAQVAELAYLVKHSTLTLAHSLQAVNQLTQYGSRVLKVTARQRACTWHCVDLLSSFHELVKLAAEHTFV